MIQTRESFFITVVLAALVLSMNAVANAQSGAYHEPLSEKLPPGYTAEVLARIRQYDPYWLQPIRVELPTEGTVSVYSSSPDPLAMIDSPAQFSVNAGHLYRLRLSNLPEFPGVEIYPSIEILDRLHPPQGSSGNYPIPVVFTEADLKEAINGRLVTRVIYLENPRTAAELDPLRRGSPKTIIAEQNALQEAGVLGRPMIIARIGGRIPADGSMPLSYFGTGGAFDLGEAVEINTGVVKLSDKKTPAESLVRGPMTDRRTSLRD